MRPYLWPAALGLLAGLAVFFIALVGGRLAPRLGSQSLAAATMLSALAVNLVLLLLAMLALLVAGAAYRRAHDSGVQQQKLIEAEHATLDQSRQALAAMSGQLTDHRKLFDATVEAMGEQLKAVQQAYEDERKRLTRKPIIDIRVGQASGAQLDSLIRVDI